MKKGDAANFRWLDFPQVDMGRVHSCDLGMKAWPRSTCITIESGSAQAGKSGRSRHASRSNKRSACICGPLCSEPWPTRPSGAHACGREREDTKRVAGHSWCNPENKVTNPKAKTRPRSRPRTQLSRGSGRRWRRTGAPPPPRAGGERSHGNVGREESAARRRIPTLGPVGKVGSHRRIVCDACEGARRTSPRHGHDERHQGRAGRTGTSCVRSPLQDDSSQRARSTSSNRDHEVACLTTSTKKRDASADTICAQEMPGSLHLDGGSVHEWAKTEFQSSPA